MEKTMEKLDNKPASSGKPVVLEVDHLTKIFEDSQMPGADESGNRVLEDLSLKVRKNDFLCVLSFGMRQDDTSSLYRRL